ncbi:hypothetical protein FBU30_002748 [Linnemannia zychae]|nr:hypothetical protein FBU30_002748 [Linnemannia zychae]
MDRKLMSEQQQQQQQEQSSNSQQALPLPQRLSEQQGANPLDVTASVNHNEPDIATDIEQHCLLFPTYATRHSRSGFKDPLDWNIRVRGWAFTKRSNRRKRLVMSMARKLAGVTKDNKVYETLESRFGMFLASNTQGARFAIQCVGVTRTSHMELAGAPSSHDSTVDELMNEMHTTEGALAIAETAKDKMLLRKSLEESRPQEYLDSHQPEPTLVTNSTHSETDGVPMTEATPSENQESRWTKGAALVRGAYRKYKPIVVAQVQYSLHGTEYGAATSLKTSCESNGSHFNNRCGSNSESIVSNNSSDGTWPSTTDVLSTVRSDSGDTILPQSETHNDDLGYGSFPTVEISSRPGGHFDGTLRVSHEDIEVHRNQNSMSGLSRSKTVTGKIDESHPRFLKLHAYNPEMKEPCHGIVNLVDPEGVSIISDIDDTIKKTDVVEGARIILENTFLKEMMDVPGMAKVYMNWWKQGAAFHYVSNSPWQLIPSLLEFFHSHKFPPGSAHLRMHDSVLKTYFMAPGENKRRNISEILTDFPDRKFILIGDSGEIDMEIYTEMAVRFPDQIIKIFIRDITSTRLKEEAIKMANTPTSRTRSLSSMLPKAPMAVVATGFNYFSRYGAGANTESGTKVNKQSMDNLTFANVSVDSLTLDDIAPTPSQIPCITGQQLPPAKPPRSQKISSQAAPSRDPPIVLGDLYNDEPMPGASPADPAVIKTPYEIWLERIETCQRQLPDGKLMFFEDASVLEECALVKNILRQYKDRQSLEELDDETLCEILL